ncbi:MAG: hypothetical protein B6D62_04000 [Candidatus Cloacimonas sp. 4484_275]|jgi:Fe2+ transport system protein FeoA|nr:MAG: hypothetical protein B6D62_04000 [Candidatus Cloacimonas sp. 4484_275]RLC51688.1 MAG: hypothetical protein DRZ79_02375 [Candidatus Cloacimonadota bacterium]
MFGWRRGQGKGRMRRRRLRRSLGNENRVFTLNEALEGVPCIVMENPDKKTVEMGIYVGNTVIVQKNDRNEPNIVVAVGESRYIIPRNLAKRILIK